MLINSLINFLINFLPQQHQSIKLYCLTFEDNSVLVHPVKYPVSFKMLTNSIMSVHTGCGRSILKNNWCASSCVPLPVVGCCGVKWDSTSDNSLNVGNFAMLFCSVFSKVTTKIFSPNHFKIMTSVSNVEGFDFKQNTTCTCSFLFK